MVNTMDTAHVDVAIIGGGAAGLAGALQLARMRRRVAVVDAGKPRNRTATAMHSFPGSDGVAPSTHLAAARADAERFGADIVEASATTITSTTPDDFVVTLDNGAALRARRVLIAAGITDELPEIPGVREQWGRSVIHCPYCHGYEVSAKRIVVLDTNGAGTHQALLFGQLSDLVTLVVADGPGPAAAELIRLDAAGIGVVRALVEAVVETDGVVSGVLLGDETLIPADAVVVGPRWRLNLDAAAELDLHLAPHPLGFGDTLVVDSMGRTSTPGVYGAGNVVDPSQQVLQAAANGSFVAAQINMDLRNEDLDRLERAAREAAEWEGRYADAGDRWWSGKPNGTLAAEVSALPVGRALDIGCGEGADAVWLAQLGWAVTAIDISPTAIERANAAADAAGVAVEFRAADVLTDPPPAAVFDLVSIQYPALLKTLGAGPLQRVFDAVAPGGVLLIVGHDQRPFEHDHDHQHKYADYSSVDELVALLPANFVVEVNEVRPRPNPPEGARHVDDVVIRALRR
ncbi:MAG: NAD(P)/FAD-dependent oxidoreductase [Actinobacteria bacterium]|nr:NAD(P)/FAD-dependent oxidoreductase [Actinomycetota bacterium]